MVSKSAQDDKIRKCRRARKKTSVYILASNTSRSRSRTKIKLSNWKNENILFEENSENYNHIPSINTAFHMSNIKLPPINMDSEKLKTSKIKPRFTKSVKIPL